MVRTQIQLTEEQYEGLKKMAAREKISMAEYVRRALDRSLRREAPLSDEVRRRMALQAMGTGHSGRSDISERHDDYFVEAIEDSMK
ncbi:MAG: ribbon-helix-helix protein, CopG family [Actinobacteria bacterium]|nr:ribbon-helix-helix protein, CopG family [Actinomycetota bacterium]MBU1943141.1 ribbon-helix-helix protein, CopG family [Actinomycetota bacterium]MBU2687912.1 ribbon-helix-helix protein, CopG family [Actinomycetota bacterium]